MKRLSYVLALLGLLIALLLVAYYGLGNIVSAVEPDRLARVRGDTSGGRSCCS